MKAIKRMKKLALTLAAACLLLLVASISANAATVHMCSGGTYTVTTIEVVPTNHGYQWHSSTSVLGGCVGDWVCVEALTIGGGDGPIRVFEESGPRSVEARVRELESTSPIVKAILSGWQLRQTSKKPLPTKEVELTREEARKQLESIEKMPVLRIVIPAKSLSPPRV
jgi:hypothetical protein